VYGWRAHLKVSLHVGLGGRLAIDFSEVVNEREVLSLFVSEGFLGHGGSVSASARTKNAESASARHSCSSLPVTYF
jgi:hypothetical protein